MLPYGGSPVCPRCSKAVYAAEQVMGPGRKLYHKFCLTCAECKKRLDSGSLVEHDEEPYCKNCHVRTFGTRDLRSANLPHREEPFDSPTNGTSPPNSPQKGASALSPTHTGSFWSSSPAPAPLGRNMTGNGYTGGSYTVGARSGRSNGLVLQPNRSLGTTSPTSPTTASPPAASIAPAPYTTSPPSSVQSLHRVAEEQETAQGGGEGAGDDTETDMEDEAVDQLLGSSDHLRSPSPERPTTAVNRLSTSRLPMHMSPVQPIYTGAPRTPFSSATLGRANSSNSGTYGSPLVATPTGSRYGRALDSPSVKSHSTGASLSSLNSLSSQNTGSPRWGAQTSSPSCAKCDKAVFFAEQVKAIGQLWHRGCLRCTECAAGLATGRVSEHENAPYCSRCYTKVHGPAGSGYALLGKAGG